MTLYYSVRFWVEYFELRYKNNSHDGKIKHREINLWTEKNERGKNKLDMAWQLFIQDK